MYYSMTGLRWADFVVKVYVSSRSCKPHHTSARHRIVQFGLVAPSSSVAFLLHHFAPVYSI